MEKKPEQPKIDLKVKEKEEIITWQSAKNELIPEAQTFLIILKCYISKKCANYLFKIYYAKVMKKNFWNMTKLYFWAILDLPLRKIDILPYRKKAVIHGGK